MCAMYWSSTSVETLRPCSTALRKPVEVERAVLADEAQAVKGWRPSDEGLVLGVVAIPEKPDGRRGPLD